MFKSTDNINANTENFLHSIIKIKMFEKSDCSNMYEIIINLYSSIYNCE